MAYNFSSNPIDYQPPQAPAPKGQTGVIGAPASTPTFWQRIQSVGIGKVNLFNAEQVAKTIVKTTAQAAEKTSNVLNPAVHGATSALNKNLDQAKANIPTGVPLNNKQIAINKGQVNKVNTLKNNISNQTYGYNTNDSFGKKVEKVAGNVGQTAALFLPGSKALEVTGEALLKTLGTKGVLDLAEKGGVDVAGRGAVEVANEVAKTKLASQALKDAAYKSQSVLKRAGKSAVKTGAGFGVFGASQAASQGESGKQVLKTGTESAAVGAVAGTAGSLLKSGVKAKLATKETPAIKKPNVAQSKSEEGFANPTQAVSDVKSLIDKHQATTKYSGDIQRGGDMVAGAKKQISADAEKVAEQTPKLSASDKKIIQDYRDAKEAGLPTKELPDKLKATNDNITALNKAAESAKVERAKLEGREYNSGINPETYVHREAQGKGGVFDQLVQGTKRSVAGGRSFGKTVGSDKARKLLSVTDEQGNRQVVAVKNESFGRIKHLTAFDENQQPTRLGKYNYDSKTNTLTNAKGEKLKLGQATTSEITKASGQKYYVNPHLTSLKNYVDSRTALENVKFIDSIKNHPDFDKFAVGPDETAPKGWQPVRSLLQFGGYKFEPKVAESLRDISGGLSKEEPRVVDKVGNLLKRTIVYFPLKHNLNQGITYAVDRGLSALVNPMAYKRGAVSLVKAFHEVTNQGEIFQKLQKAGSSLPSADEEVLNKYITKELKGLSPDNPSIIDLAKKFSISPIKAYNAIQHIAVWQFGDILNVARVIERMEPKLLSKGMSFEDAMKATEKYSLQYKVPSRIGGKLLPGKAGRSASRLLQSPMIFFGRYKYDLYKIMTNAIKDSTNLKTLVKDPKSNVQALDKLVAMAFGTAIVWPLVDKGLQKLSGNPNAYMKAPGALELPEAINQLKSGKKGLGATASNQLYVSGVLTAPLDIKANKDSFTGKDIYDPNASGTNQLKQVGKWLMGQVSFGQKAATLGNAKGNKAVDVILSLASTNFPKNSPEMGKLYSLQYDSLPSVQSQAKAQAKKGDFAGAQKTISGYNQQIMTAAKNALNAAGVPVPPDNILINRLKKAGVYYSPQGKTIQGWQTSTPKNAANELGL